MSNFAECEKELPKYIGNMLEHLEVPKYKIKVEQTDEGIKCFIDVSEEDRGKVIGKEGRIITSIRTLVNSYTRMKGFKATVIVDRNINGKAQ